MVAWQVPLPVPRPTPHALSSQGVLHRLELLLELARAARDQPEAAVIAVAAQTVRDALGYEEIVFNRYRRAYDDYEVVLTLGDDELRRTLLHTSSPRDAWEARLFLARDEVRPGIYFQPADRAEPWDDIAPSYVRDAEPIDDPAHWHPMDSLLVRVDTAAGAPLGVFSIDAPASGLRPRSDDLALLAAVRDHVSLALETTRASAEVERHRDQLAHLLGAATRIAGAGTSAAVLAELAGAATTGLDFERAALYRREQLDELAVVAVSGWWPDAATPALRRPLPVRDALSLLDASPARDGCHVATPGALRRPASDAERGALASQRNGRGVHAWRDQILLVPMRDAEGALVGLLAVEDPLDRLMPDAEVLQALRLLAHQAQSALAAIGQRDDLAHLASHDPLTGLRNRRSLDHALEAMPRPAVLLFDLDRLGRVNEALGHDVGDVVLQRFATILIELSGERDLVLRLAGEEFCLLAPELGLRDATAYAERIRRATRAGMGDLVPGLTVSVGVAAPAEQAQPSPRALMTAADAALSAAKARGRNAAVAAPPVG